MPNSPKGLLENLKWLDPFTYVDAYLMPRVKASKPIVQWAVFAFSFAFLLTAAFLVLGGSIFVAAVIAAIYVYLLVAERNSAVEWAVYILSAFLFAFVLYNFVLVFLLGSSSPIVIVYSGSMEPVLYRGDVVFLGSAASLELKTVDLPFPISGKRLSEFAEIGVASSEKFGFRQAGLRINNKDYGFDASGPIVVYYSVLRKQDIIHRAVLRLRAQDGDFLITFGDNNGRIDADCKTGTGECIVASPMPLGQAKGKYLFHVPLLGYVKLLVFDDLPRMLLRQGQGI